jgi:ribosomal protein S18 acetylase RimI-like enzyme
MMKHDITSRTYASEQDLRSMLDVLLAVRPREQMADYPGIVDLQELMGIASMSANTRLWFDMDGRAIGFAFVDSFDNLRFEFDPRRTDAPIEDEIMAWGIACMQRKPHENGAHSKLDTSCRAMDTERIALLQRHGFNLQSGTTLHMVRPLAEPIPEATVPPGFSIRSVVGLGEAEALAALHRAAFGTEHMTTERRLAMMQVPEYDPTSDLAVIAPDGSLAAYTMCSISEQENHITGRKDGFTDPVATHPAFQRRGLARALLLTGMHLLRARGMDMARLSTSSNNVAMQHAARSVGFRVESTTIWFAKDLEGHSTVC